MISGIAVWLSCYAFRASGLLLGNRKQLFFGVLAVGIVMQLWSFSALQKVSRDSAAVERKLLAKKSDTVITDLFFIPEMTPKVMSEKIVLECASAKQFKIVKEFLKNNDISSFTLILSPHYRRLDNKFLAEILRFYPIHTPPEKVIVGNSLEIFVAECKKK